MAIGLKRQSSLDLHLEGSIGSFKVSKEKQESLEVKYFLTHVSLDLAGGGQNEKFLKQLCPVREIFDVNQQEFDEMMQRDIDDARVSKDLVPYILDSSQTGTIKFFPPIVVMCLPIKNDSNNPDDFYPEVFQGQVEGDDFSPDGYAVTRSGKFGSEVFEFKQPISDGEALPHDLARLSINTSKTRMIIVDGQHRAMALLALYRNLRDDWSDEKRRPFKSYYSEWSPEYIKEFDLDSIQLPVILCTVPTLDNEYTGDADLKKAARSIFLTLNKNAKPVTKTRNMLLDDNDLISHFMRGTLSKIKNGDERSNTTLDIYCIELDQDGDKQKISNPIALSAVNHFYYMVEHLMLNTQEDVNGVSSRGGRFSTRTTNEKIRPALERLDCFNLLGSDAMNTIRRDFFSNQQVELLTNTFESRYGQYIARMFQRFGVFSAHTAAAEKLRREVESHSDVHLKPMLFEGQGMIRTFEAHRENLAEKLKKDSGYFTDEVPKIESIKSKLDSTKIALEEAIDNFKEYRARNFLSALPDSQIFEGEKVKPFLRKMIDEWYSNIFTSVAFQSGIICGFFYELEKKKELFQFDEVTLSLFDEYLESIETYLLPQSIPKLRGMISLLSGKVEGSVVDDFINISRGSSDSFRAVVYPAEMQPDAWTSYKYLFCEMWEKRLDNEEIKESLSAGLVECREQIKSNLLERMKSNYIKEHRLPTDESLDEDILKVLKATRTENFKLMLSYIEKSSVL